MGLYISKFAPVIISVLDRYEHFRKCFESLERCIFAKETTVFVALDYPPSNKYISGWMQVDAYLHEKETANSFKELVVIRRKYNYGIKGENSNVRVLIREVANKYDRFIESEDDNVYSPNFLVFMNQCLEKYKNDPDVIAVTGYSFPIEWKISNGATVQKQTFNASAWGRGWWTDKFREVQHTISSGELYNNAYRVIRNNKNLGIFVAFYEYVCASIIPLSYLKKVQSGRLAVTDYCTRQYLFVYDKYVISPLVSKVGNIGLDGSGAYCQNNQAVDCDGRDSWHTDFANQEIDQSTSFEIVENNPEFLEENRRRLDKYEWRPLSQHIIANLIAWGIRVFGLRFMRGFTSLVFKVWHRRVN